jgi:hypothetical protein
MLGGRCVPLRIAPPCPELRGLFEFIPLYVDGFSGGLLREK